MLSIKINNHTVDINSNIKISIDAISPIYYGDRSPNKLPGTKVYAFSLPKTPRNRLILDRPEILTNFNSLLSNTSIEIYFNTKLLLTGICKVKEAGNQSDYKIQMTAGAAGNLSVMKTSKVGEAVDEDISLGANETDAINYANAVALTPDNYNFVFPKVTITADSSADVTNINNYYNNTYFRQGTDADGAATSTLVPMPRARHIIQKIFEYTGYTLNNFMDDDNNYAEFKDLILFNNYSLDKLNADTNNITLTDLAILPNINLKNHVPDMYMNKFVQDTILPFGGVMLINTELKTIRITNFKEILNDSAFLDITKKVLREYIIEEMITVPDGLEYNHISGDGATEYHQFWQNTNNLEAPVERYVDLPADPQGTRRLVYSQNQYYFQYNVQVNANWGFLGKKLNPAPDSTTNPLELTSDTLFLERDVGYGTTIDRLVPLFFSNYISPINPDTEPLSKSILLFYRGFDTEQGGQNYPFASNNVYNRAQVKIADYSLLCDGDYGLYETWWKDWLTLLNTAKPVILYARLSHTDINDFKWERRIRVGQHNYFVKRIQTTIGTDGLTISKLECLKIL